jgi:hypothetical protein
MLASKKFNSVAEYNNYCTQLKLNKLSFSTKIRKGKKNKPPEYSVDVLPNAD